MAKNIIKQSDPGKGTETKVKDKKKVRKDEKTSKKKSSSKKHKAKAKKASSSTSKSSASSNDSSSNESSADPEQTMSSLALQLSLSQSQLKLKGGRVMKVEDLSPEQLAFLICQPAGGHKQLPELSTFTLHECGGELFQMRKQATTRLQGKVSKRKQLVNEELRTQAQAEEACKMTWKKRILEIYESFGCYVPTKYQILISNDIYIYKYYRYTIFVTQIGFDEERNSIVLGKHSKSEGARTVVTSKTSIWEVNCCIY